MKTFKLHLIRHGMTEGNLKGLYIAARISLCATRAAPNCRS